MTQGQEACTAVRAGCVAAFNRVGLRAGMLGAMDT